jgi:flagellar assembly protein FliH
MLQKVEPNIRRMEYRMAFTRLGATPSTLEDREASVDSQPDFKSVEESHEEASLLRAQLQELEEQLKQRDRNFEERLEVEIAAAFERGRKQEASDRAALVEKMACSLDRAVSEFGTARDSYLAQVEQEVVRLALSIATRILHRESQMDPLLLSGAVRVALGQLSDTTEVRLRVPTSQFSLWNEMMQFMPHLPLRPQLVSDDTLEADECSLETHLGSVELGVKAQLAEIERGFFDLLEHREPVRRDGFKVGMRPEEA